MSIEPVQDLVRIKLEMDGYFVRSNVRFKITSSTATGKTASYSDLDIIAVKINPRSGAVTDRIWGETKAHLTLSLRAAYLREYLSGYAVMLNPDRIEAPQASKTKWRTRKTAAFLAAKGVLGSHFRRVLYFGGKKAADGGKGAAALLDSDIEVVYIRDFASGLVSSLGHQEGSEPLVRVINLLKAYEIVVP